MNFESLIFDVDGTLWNSVPLVAKGWNLALTELGLEPNCTPEGILPLFGLTMDRIADAMMPQLPPEVREKNMAMCMERENQVLREDPCHIFYPGVIDTLHQLAKTHRLFIVSNCQKGYIEILLEKGGLGSCILDHACFGDTGTCKGETIRRLMVRNSIENAAYIGDTQGDLEAAEYAGIPFIFAAYGFGHPDHWNAKIDTFHQLAQILRF